MPKSSRETLPKPMLDAAADWFVRRDAGDVSAADERAFERWLATDPRHGAAYAEIERTWTAFDAVPPALVPRVGARASVVGPRRVRRWAAAVAVAASMLIAAVLGTDVPTRLQSDAFTATGESETVRLPDGSTAVLNTASAIAFDFTGKERRVRLLKGEAAFDVAKDPDRPFRVTAADGTATALGTVFSVRRFDDAAVAVSVTEGRVSVVYGADGNEAVLTANQRVAYGSGGLGDVSRLAPGTVDAWRRGKLVFEARPLGDVIGELNRYHAGAIRIIDPSVAARPVSGVFETGDPVAVVDALEASLGLSSLRLTDRLVLIYR